MKDILQLENPERYIPKQTKIPGIDFYVSWLSFIIPSHPGSVECGWLLENLCSVK
jgi:hypothetical protein